MIPVYNHVSALQRRVMCALSKIMSDSETISVHDGHLIQSTIKSVPIHLVRPAIYSLILMDYISEGLENGDRYYIFTPKGAEYVFDILQEDAGDSRLGAQGDQLVAVDSVTLEIIPASDRFVSPDHNSKEYIEAQEALKTLVEDVRGSNNLVADPKEKLAIELEIANLKSAFEQPMVRVARFWEATRKNGIVGWLGERVANAIVRASAARALEAICKFFGFI